MSATIEELRGILAAHARLNVDPAALGPGDDLYQAGMTSHASVNVMLAIEDAFDIEFPDELLKPSVFQTLGTIEGAVTGLQGAEAA